MSIAMQGSGDGGRSPQEWPREPRSCSALVQEVVRIVLDSDLTELGLMNLEHLSILTRTSRSRLCRRFREETGHCLADYIRVAKMVRSALTLLREPNLRVRDVMEQAGFSCPDHFRRVFRSCFCRPPSSFRLLNGSPPPSRT